MTPASPTKHPPIRKRSRTRTAVHSAVVLGVLVVALEIRDIAKAVGIDIPGLPVPRGGSVMDNLLSVALAVVAVIALDRARRLSLRAALGLRWNGWKGPLLTLLATIPCWIGLSTQGALVDTIELSDMLLLALLFPFAEELVFRGFGFVFARRVVGWPVVIAALVQAIVFGALHWLGAGGGVGGVALQIFAITFLGGLVFAALDARDGYTVWSGLVFHVSLNAAWNVFSVSDTAAAGWVGSSLRIGSAVLALVLLWMFVPRGPRPCLSTTRCVGRGDPTP
ncbi:MAG: lysostaphin resistance A-like protein [Luteimonas sp.]